MAISVGNQVITESQIDEEVRVTAFLNNEKVDLSADQKKKAAARLIEQALIKREMDLSRYPCPTLSDADSALKDVQSHYPSQSAFEQALADHGITEAQLKEHLWWQLTVSAFRGLSLPPRHPDLGFRGSGILSTASVQMAAARC